MAILLFGRSLFDGGRLGRWLQLLSRLGGFQSRDPEQFSKQLDLGIAGAARLRRGLQDVFGFGPGKACAMTGEQGPEHSQIHDARQRPLSSFPHIRCSPGPLRRSGIEDARVLALAFGGHKDGT
ncbi:MAG: hypothetical protein ABR587_03590 [Candidatus Binatia bacterium]